MSEASRRQAIRTALTRAGYLVTAYPAGPFGGRGVADFIVCALGRYGEIEVKDDDGEETPAQLARQEQVRRAGGFAFTARTPADALRGVTRALQEIPNKWSFFS